MDLAYLRAAFGWTGEVTMAPGPRGATARIWRLSVSGEAGAQESFALKEILGDPPAEAAVRSEVEFTSGAAALGVRVAKAFPDRTGRYLITDPAGRVLRLYEWLDLRPVIPAESAAALGALLARLHRAAPSDMGPPSDMELSAWYETLPAEGLPRVAVEGLPSAAVEGVPVPDAATVAALARMVTPSAPGRLRICHRDLHPENVQADPSGALVVLDWDDLGPADPARELARVLFDWYCDPGPDVVAIRTLLGAYREGGGPARITGRADFTMLIATRLNFLRSQYRLLADPGRRDWARQEIEEGVRLLPTPRLIDEVVAVALDS